jgi:hypothetical protein
MRLVKNHDCNGPAGSTVVPTSAPYCPIPSCPRGSATNQRSLHAANNDGNGSHAKHARKDRGPNWLPQEIAALIVAKREMFLEELDTNDGRDLMNLDSTKWIYISQHVMRVGFSPYLREGPAYKTKWN